MDSAARTPAVLLLVLLCIVGPPFSRAFEEPGHEHGLPNLDKRLDSQSADKPLPAEKSAAAGKLRGQVHGLHVEHDVVRQSPKHIAATSGFLTGPGGEGATISAAGARTVPAGDPHRVIKAFLNEHRAAFGHGAELLDQTRLKTDFVARNNNLRTIVWEQRLDDISVYESVLIGHVTARGELVSVSSQLVAEPSAAANAGTPNRVALQNAPTLSDTEAVRLAADSLGELLAASDIVSLTAQPAGSERRQTFKAGGLPGTAQAKLTWLPLNESSLRLCWEIDLTRRFNSERYRVLLDAQTGELQIRQRLTVYLTPASFNVFTSDSPSPFSPGWQTPDTNQPPLVPRTLVTLSALNTNASPIGWISDGGNETRGNNVDAHTDLNGDDIPDLPRPQGSPFRVFNPPLDLAQSPTTYSDAAVVQLFYWCNWMHDRLYELGFDEASGNFQKDNFGRGGLGNDAIIADAQDGSGFNNANFTPSPDGVPGRIQMFIWTGPNPDVDGDFDAEVVLHEYVHGLSTRLVGGGVGISSSQAAGMGEGWSDFYALAFLSEPGDDLDAAYGFGGYVTHQLSVLRENYYFGIRRYPYSTDLSKNPLTFKDIDPAQISPHPGVPMNPLYTFSPLQAPEVHAQGEVWCAMLWEARANLIRKHGFSVGNQLILQLVTDGMKLSPPNPTFTQARDAIILADLVNNSGANYGDLWAAFAKRGLGFSAIAANTATTSGIVEAYDLPDALFLNNTATFAASGPVGGPINPACLAYPITNISTQAVVWSVSANQSWLSLSPSNGTLAPGEAAVVNACLTADANALPLGYFTDTITFSNHVTGITQTRRAEVRVLSFAAMPFHEDFESGVIGPAWSVTGTADYQTRLTFLDEPHGGTNHLILDCVGGRRSRNELTLGLDLGGYTNVVLKFWARSFGDEADGPPTRPFQVGADFDGVAISEDGVTWYEVQSLRDIPPIYTEFTVDLDAALEAFGLRYTSTFQIRFNQVDDFAVPFDGIALDDISVTGNPATRLLLTIPTAAREGDSVLVERGVVQLGSPVATPTVISLSISDTKKLSVPPTVTVPAGTNRVEFIIRVFDDAQLDGTVPVIIRADAPGYFSSSATINVADNEKATLRVNLPRKIREGGRLQKEGIVRVHPRPSRDVLVRLQASHPEELRVPGSVTIAAGEASAEFDLVAVDDNRIDGAKPVMVTAHVDNWIDGGDSILVLDNEIPRVTVVLPPSISEADGVKTNAGIVRLSGTLSTSLSVSLSSSDATRLTVPSSVEIPAGALEQHFDLTAIDNATTEGMRSVRIRPSAAGFSSRAGTIDIIDDETPPLVYNPEPANGATNIPVSVELRWSAGVGEILRNGGFETGDFSGWLAVNGCYGAWIINDGTINPDGPEETNAPVSGSYNALVAQIGGGTHLLFQDVRIPAEALGATLSWTDRIRNHASYFAPNQVFRAEIRDQQNTVLDVAFTTQLGDPLLSEWTPRQFSLDRYRGQTVRIAFYQEDSTGYFNTYLDDVSVRLGDAATPTTFDVYFGTTTNLGPAEFLGNTTNASWTTPGLSLNSTYYWQVRARRGSSVAAGPLWQFTTRGVGRVHHFEWARVASPQTTGERFPITVTAKDDLNNTVKDFTGAVAVAGLPGSGTASSIVISELDVGLGDSVEFLNVSGLPVDLSGWQISIYDNTSWPAPVGTVTIPSGAVCPAGAMFTLSDNGEAPGQFPRLELGTNVNWSFAPLGNPMAVLMRDAGGDVVDFVSAGNADAERITVPRKIPAAKWSGLPVFVVVTNTTFTIQRTGAADHNDASDWTAAAPTFGAFNDGLELPFAPQGNVPVSPNLLTNFVTGVWNGFLTVEAAAPRLTLEARSPTGRSGRANEIAVVTPNDIAVTVADSPDVTLVGGELRYFVTVTNPGPTRVTGLFLTNFLPSGVTFVSSSTFNGACTNLDGSILCALDGLSAGDSARITFNTRTLTMGTLTNTAIISRAAGDPFLGNNQASAVTTVTGPFITVTNVALTEGSGVTNRLRIPIRLSEPAPLPVSVEFATSNFTATAGLDYLATNGVLVFEPGVTNLSVEVAVIGDRVDESLDIFFVNLSSATNGVIAVGQARCRVTDDDPTPQLAIRDVIVTEGSTGSTNFAEFILQLSGLSGIEVSSTFSTADRTATAPSDYLTTFGTITFQPGVTSQIIRVPIVGDRRFEPEESFTLILFNTVGMVPPSVPPKVTILDDDDRELDHFVWSDVPSPQFVDVPFMATLSARDGLDRPATSFTGPVNVRGIANRRSVGIGSGTNTWDYPLATLFHDARAQIIYLANELGGAGKINGLTLNVAAVPGQTLSNWTIRLKHSLMTNYTRAAWETSGWTIVYQRAETITSPGRATFLFETPFDYNGTNSLLADFSFNDVSFTVSGLVRSTITPQRRALVFQTDSAFGDPLRWDGSSAPPPLLVDRIPNLEVQFETPVNLSPAEPVTVTNGIWIGPVTVHEPWRNLFLRASDGDGRIAEGNTFDVESSADTDGDGLPDAWERGYFGSINGGASDDVDGDGVNSLQEFRSGTNPADRESAALIRSVRANGADLVVRFRSVNAKLYQLEKSPALGTGNWALVGSAIPGNGTELSVTDPGATRTGGWFYRLRVLP
jgi:uncharacterized repeat protein (TIGR01451 family)